MAEGSSRVPRDYILHKAAFHGDWKGVKGILKNLSLKTFFDTSFVGVGVNQQDRHGEFYLEPGLFDFTSGLVMTISKCAGMCLNKATDKTTSVSYTLGHK